MRAVLLVLIVAIVAVIGAVATGFVNISQIRGARAPEISATDNGITAKSGEAPAFDVETGSVKVGTSEANFAVPKVTLERDKKKVSVPTLEVRPAEPQTNKAAQ